MNNYSLKIILSVLAVAGFVTAFFCDPAAMVTGVSDALTLCGTAVIPPLFPFIVLSDFMVRSGLSDVIGTALTPVSRFAFNLPGNAGCAVLMSAVGGYPVGARMIAQLIENGKITRRQGRRMLLFCVNAGPAFVIGTVGSVILSSRKAGILLYLSLLLSALFIGFFLRLFDGKSQTFEQEKAVFDPGVISQSVLQGTNSMLTLCGWILVFSSSMPFVSKLPLGESTIIWLNIITEVTNGCRTAAGVFPVSVLALVMGWSGLCIHCQLLPSIKITGLKIRYFFLSRIVHGALATALATVLFRFFPCEISVFSTNTVVSPTLFSVSVPATVAMLAMCAFVILDNNLKRHI